MTPYIRSAITCFMVGAFVEQLKEDEEGDLELNSLGKIVAGTVRIVADIAVGIFATYLRTQLFTGSSSLLGKITSSGVVEGLLIISYLRIRDHLPSVPVEV